MRINHKILSIPPYISTSWKNVLSLHMESRGEGHVLIIGLVNGSIIEIPNLEKTILQAVFAAHEKFIEQENTIKMASAFPELPLDATVIGLPIEQLGHLLHHNPEGAHTPDLPKEMLKKISSLAKVVGLEQGNTLPKAEPHCNCTHCQIMRALASEESEEVESPAPEEEVSELDLHFRDWEIRQTTDKLYLVTNPLNQEEHYNVFLGEPIGCTCGEKNCEHIRAVLNS